jgi:hypothetical protein
MCVSGLRGGRRGVLAGLVLACMLAADPAPAGELLSGDGFRLIEIDGAEVRWATAAEGAPVEISYGLVKTALVRPGARNCPSMTPIMEADAFLVDLQRAMDAWQAGANVRFVAAPPGAVPDLLFGMQGEPVGIAYTDLELKPGAMPGSASEIERSAVCFNPELPWETASFDGDPATPNVFYAALHEIGHVLGLDHVLDANAIMDFRNLEQLHAPQSADLRGAQALYGVPAVAVAAD